MNNFSIYNPELFSFYWIIVMAFIIIIGKILLNLLLIK